MLPQFFGATVKLGELFRCGFGIEFFTELFKDFALFFKRKFFNLLQNLRRTHGGNLLFCFTRASKVFPPRAFIICHSTFILFPVMIPREILKKIRQIEIRTNRIVTETLAGQYHSVFKGQGMNFDEVREYQPGDDVRSIDWNVTARMNHPFIKKFVEERELTLMLVVDVSGSGLFGSREQSKRELAAEIASVLAFSAIRNNDKVGLLLFTDEVEKFIPPRKGRGHVLRVIREVLFFEPKRRGTNLRNALEFVGRVTPHKAIVVVVSDFLESAPTIPLTRRDATLSPSDGERDGVRGAPPKSVAPTLTQPISQPVYTALRQANRRHDVVAVHVSDPYEMELPALGRMILEDAETGQVIELNTGIFGNRAAFKERQDLTNQNLARMFRSAGIDTIQLRTDQPYGAALGRFFEAREKRRLHV